MTETTKRSLGVAGQWEEVFFMSSHRAKSLVTICLVMNVSCALEPPERQVTAQTEVAVKNFGTLVKGSAGVKIDPERVRQEVTPEVANWEVIDYRMCAQYAKGVLTREDYRTFTREILPVLQERAGRSAEESSHNGQKAIIDNWPIAVEHDENTSYTTHFLFGDGQIKEETRECWFHIRNVSDAVIEGFLSKIDSIDPPAYMQSREIVPFPVILQFNGGPSRSIRLGPGNIAQVGVVSTSEGSRGIRIAGSERQFKYQAKKYVLRVSITGIGRNNIKVEEEFEIELDHRNKLIMRRHSR